jgi:uncharacterized protein with FMN-binding domain
MNKVKKIALGLFVAASFVVYALHGRSEASGAVATPKTSSSTSPPNSGTNTATPPSSPMVSTSASQLKDGTYTGDAADAVYGNIQVQAVIQGGKLTDVIFLQSPNDRSASREINSQATPMLKQEAISAQSAQVDGVSGATDSSQAFVQSLGSALKQASA